MRLMVEAAGIVLLLISSISVAVGVTGRAAGEDVYRGVLGGLVLLVFRLYRKVAILEIERNALIFELKKETAAMHSALTSQESIEICRILLGVLGRR